MANLIPGVLCWKYNRNIFDSKFLKYLSQFRECFLFAGVGEMKRKATEALFLFHTSTIALDSSNTKGTHWILRLGPPLVNFPRQLFPLTLPLELYHLTGRTTAICSPWSYCYKPTIWKFQEVQNAENHLCFYAGSCTQHGFLCASVLYWILFIIIRSLEERAKIPY